MTDLERLATLQSSCMKTTALSRAGSLARPQHHAFGCPRVLPLLLWQRLHRHCLKTAAPIMVSFSFCA